MIAETAQLDMTEEIAEEMKLANAAHAKAVEHDAKSLEFAYTSGKHLEEVRRLLEHGKWMDYIKEHFAGSYAKSYDYCLIYRFWNDPRVRDKDGKLTVTSQNQFLKAIRPKPESDWKPPKLNITAKKPAKEPTPEVEPQEETATDYLKRRFNRFVDELEFEDPERLATDFDLVEAAITDRLDNEGEYETLKLKVLNGLESIQFEEEQWFLEHFDEVWGQITKAVTKNTPCIDDFNPMHKVLRNIASRINELKEHERIILLQNQDRIWDAIVRELGEIKDDEPKSGSRKKKSTTPKLGIVMEDDDSTDEMACG